MRRLTFGPFKKLSNIHLDLPVRRQFHTSAIHGPRRRTFEINSFTVVAAAVARALEFVFAGFPIRSAAEMRATRVDDEKAVGRAVYPDAIFLLPLGVHAKRVVGGIADFENGGRFEQRTRKKKSQEGDEPRTEEPSNRSPHKTSATFIQPA